MPMGTRHRLTGRLMQEPRGLVLELEGGGVYALDVGRSAHKLLGHRVTVDGERSGFDRLDVTRIGLADDR
ncbi:MAG: hypothetical protein EON59_01005 [Alphaproteobacteria bacterium]|nr:MAG: hypothetical protein EON59_01005 [Alphaproteobacteria bacterium]